MQSSPIRLFHLTDLHFWKVVYNPLHLMNKRMLGNLNLALRRRRYVKQQLAESVVELVGQQQPDALLLGGDLTTTATAAEYEKAASFLASLRAQGKPLFVIPGNHDCYTFESRRKGRYEAYLGASTEDPAAPSLAVLPGGAPLLRLPTARPNLISSRGYISDAQLEQTQALLAALPASPLLVLAHYPLLHRTSAYHSGYGRQLGNATELRHVLGRSGRTILYLAGHVHQFSHARDPWYPNLEQITSYALFYQKRGHAPGFTEIQLDAHRQWQAFPWRYDKGWRRLEASRSE